MIFPIVEAYSTSAIIDMMQDHSGLFLYNKALAGLGKKLYDESQPIFEAGNLPELDSKTMFPTKIASLPGVERKVLQRRVYGDNNSYSPKLDHDMNLVSMTLDLLASSMLISMATKYSWDKKTKSNVTDPTEWVLNIANYPFQEGKDGQVLFPAHKDWGTMAIYPYIKGGGLEAYVDNQWQAVEVPENCLFFYAGDVLSKLTGGEVKPLLHRVIQPLGQTGSRTSIIFYVDPIRNMILPDGQIVGDIMDAKLRKIGQMK